MIYIDEKTRIAKVDDNNLQIESLHTVHKKKNGIETGEVIERWEWEGYYGDLSSALIGIYKKKLFETVEQGILLQDIAKHINDVGESIKTSVKSLKTSENELV